MNGLAGAQSARGAGLSPTWRLGQPEPEGLQPHGGEVLRPKQTAAKCAAGGWEPRRPAPAGALRAVTLPGHRGSLAPPPPTARRPLTSVWAAGNGGCWGFSLLWRPLSPAGQRGAEGTGGGAPGGLSRLSLWLSRPRQVAGLGSGAELLARHRWVFRSLSSHSPDAYTRVQS